MALKDDGTVYTWGSNDYGMLGDGVYESDAPYSSTNPVQVVGVYGIGDLTNVTAIDAGVNHNMVLLADGTVLSWGANDIGQLGIGASDYDYHPVPMITLEQTPPLT